MVVLENDREEGGTVGGNHRSEVVVVQGNGRLGELHTSTSGGEASFRGVGPARTALHCSGGSGSAATCGHCSRPCSRC